MHFNRECPYTSVYWFSSRYLVQLGLGELGLPVVFTKPFRFYLFPTEKAQKPVYPRPVYEPGGGGKFRYTFIDFLGLQGPGDGKFLGFWLFRGSDFDPVKTTSPALAPFPLHSDSIFFIIKGML